MTRIKQRLRAIGWHMPLQRLLTTISFFMVDIALAWISYRIHIAGDAGDLRSVMSGLLLPLCVFAVAAFVALSATKAVIAIKGCPPHRWRRCSEFVGAWP